MNLWEILIPVADNDGNVFSEAHHTAWRNIAIGVAGGLTILPTAEGFWRNPDGVLFREPMTPVRIAADSSMVIALAGIAKEFYRQEAIMCYQVGTNVNFID